MKNIVLCDGVVRLIYAFITYVQEDVMGSELPRLPITTETWVLHQDEIDNYIQQFGEDNVTVDILDHTGREWIDGLEYDSLDDALTDYKLSQRQTYFSEAAIQAFIANKVAEAIEQASDTPVPADTIPFKAGTILIPQATYSFDELDDTYIYSQPGPALAAPNWTPDAAPALWTKVQTEPPVGEYPVWTMEDAPGVWHLWQPGEKAWFPTLGSDLYENHNPNNTFAPDTMNGGWAKVET